MHPFAERLLLWAESLVRPMPWRGERDPYRVWLSEVILQQTRVAQGAAYYHRFLEAFPTVSDLAKASEDEVLALWQGLGYYSRARNLHKAAKQVADLGRFPDTYKDLLKLPGVGPYTAAAVGSLAFGLPVAVVDGNVYRVLSRQFGVHEPIDRPAGQRTFATLAQELLPPSKAAAYNQAIMDFGATVCMPKAPQCRTCPVNTSCEALAAGQVQQLPRKVGKVKRRTRYFDYLHIADSVGRILTYRRPAGDIWQGLYDLPLVESETSFAERPAIEVALAALGLVGDVESVSQPRKHVLSHQDLLARYWRVEVTSGHLQHSREDNLGQLPTQYEWTSREELLQRGIPKLLQRYLTETAPTLQFDA